ncbi:hypothetical protein LAZ67_8003967 [Cordylochernes scorpioides]|uniref:G-protein coupled receptors family 1 profile domain-containing protein n=1 Tax=Cordylochernes scorpioides TaxID=51811 RepID=A0ABY6KTL0_9ARAC|nr:hypothetical protein LAZ67_8003967 [Cordylochernes scorpioides]
MRLLTVALFDLGLAVTSGTVGLALLSVYRYISVRQTAAFRVLNRPACVRGAIVAVWAVAALASLPIAAVRETQELAVGDVSVGSVVEIGLRLITVGMHRSEELRFAFAQVDQTLIHKPHVTFCVERWSSEVGRRAFTACSLLVMYALPCVVLLACHALVSRTLCQREPPTLSRNDARQRSFRSGSSTASSHTSHGAARLRTRQRLGRVLMAMTLCFVVCWLPYHLVSFYVDLTLSPAAVTLLPFALLLGHAHSAVNPLIYWMMSRSVRKRCVHLPPPTDQSPSRFQQVLHQLTNHPRPPPTDQSPPLFQHVLRQLTNHPSPPPTDQSPSRFQQVLRQLTNHPSPPPTDQSPPLFQHVLRQLTNHRLASSKSSANSPITVSLPARHPPTDQSPSRFQHVLRQLTNHHLASSTSSAN